MHEQLKIKDADLEELFKRLPEAKTQVTIIILERHNKELRSQNEQLTKEKANIKIIKGD